MLLFVTDDIGILSFSGLLLFLLLSNLLLLSFFILLLSPSVKLPKECKGLVNIWLFLSTFFCCIPDISLKLSLSFSFSPSWKLN